MFARAAVRARPSALLSRFIARPRPGLARPALSRTPSARGILTFDLLPAPLHRSPRQSPPPTPSQHITHAATHIGRRAHELLVPHP